MAKCQRSRRFPAISAASVRRKLLETMACGCSVSRRHGRNASAFPSKPPPDRPKPVRNGNIGSDRLSELLKVEISDPDSDSDSASGSSSDEVRRKIEAFEELQSAVKGLQRESGERRRSAAAAVRRLAKGDAEARETLAMLGAIPPLIAMIDSDDLESQISALYALLNLGIGNDVNKGAIVKAGAVHKMLDLMKSRTHPSISEAIVANFLGLSALDANKPIIGSSGAIPFLVKTFQFPPSPQSQQDSLRALFNLSISTSNLPLLIGSGLVPALLSSVGDMDLSDRVLAVLSNLVSAPEGRRAVTGSSDGVAILIDVLNWIDSPACQEKSAYILMIIAHKSDGDRAAMMNLGIKSALLELVLVGSTLAQKRASRILEILRVDKGKQPRQVSGGGLGLPAVSAPLAGEAAGEDEGMEREAAAGMSEERRAVRELVNESLQSNLKRIVKRANMARDFGSSDRFPGIAYAGGSKSLPF